MTNNDGGGRPRPKTMVRLDVYNAYARLGVSPLLPTDEIKEVINRKRKEVMRRRRTRGEQQFGEEDNEMTRLQEIEDEIGTPKARARYDQRNPQNELLTIQPGPADKALDSRHRTGLATAWLVEELGREKSLPSPECLTFWAPKGLDPELIEFLTAFVTAEGHEAHSREAEKDVLPDLVALSRHDLAAGPGDCPQSPVARSANESSLEHGEGSSENG